MRKFLSVLLAIALIIFFAAGTHASSTQTQVKLKIFTYYPNPHKEKRVSILACSPTTDDQVNDYLLAGWRMPASGVTYKINYGTKPKNLSNNQVFSAVSNAFNTWSSADSKHIFNYSGGTEVKTAKYDGTNAILFKRVSSSAIAITYIWYYPSSGLLAEVDTVFNKIHKWSYTYPQTGDCAGTAGTYDLQNIGTHEFGHWVGLDDLYSDADRDLTMYGYGTTAELKKSSLGLGDITGVNAVAP